MIQSNDRSIALVFRSKVFDFDAVNIFRQLCSIVLNNHKLFDKYLHDLLFYKFWCSDRSILHFYIGNLQLLLY